MDEIEALCERIIVIDNGAIFNDGTLENLRSRVNPERRLKVEFSENIAFSHDEVRIVSREGNTLHLSFNPNEMTTTGLIQLLSESYPVKDLFVENPPIEEIIAQLYETNS